MSGCTPSPAADSCRFAWRCSGSEPSAHRSPGFWSSGRSSRNRIQLTHVFNRDVARKRAAWVPSSVVWTENVDELFASNPDVVVEVIGGIEPVGAWVRRALEQGAAVVTANKQLLAAHGPELLHLAATHDTQLRFEAAVGGGVPLIHGVREGLAGDNLTRVAGILNGTSNYVLSRMSAGGDEPMSAVLDDARKLGYAEADPSADIDGDDAGAKLVVLAGIAFRRHLKLADIPRRSIRPISAADFRYARRLGCTIRQISHGRGAAATAFTPSSARRSSRADRTSVSTWARTTSSRSAGSTAARAASAAPAPAARRRRSPSSRTCWR